MFKKTYFFLLFLVLMYGLIPLKISEILGSEFLVGDFIDANLFTDLFIMTLSVAFFLSPMLIRNITLPKLNTFGKFAEKTGYQIYLTYLFFLILLGIFLRFTGTERNALLAILSSTFIQGMGIVLILFYLKFIKTNKKIIVLVSILFCTIDILYMGKQYFISLVTILIYLADLNSFKIKFVHLMAIFVVSIFFIFIINFSRGDFTKIDLFSSLMEFRGVLSSIQFEMSNVSIFDLNGFRLKVEKLCYEIYGYNLAFHPLLYFRSITGFTTLNIFVYALIVFSLFRFMIKTIGAYAILIISLNFIHFLRHGIDLFVIKIMVQFLIILIFRFKLDFKDKALSNNKLIGDRT